MASRIASLPEEKWNKKIFDWHPGLDNRFKTRRMVGRPNIRWEDDINEFIKPREVKERTNYDLMNNNSWMTEAKKNAKSGKIKKFNEKSSAHFPDRRAKRYKKCFVLTHPTQVVLDRNPHHGGIGSHLSVVPTS